VSFKGRPWKVPQAFCGERVAIPGWVAYGVRRIVDLTQIAHFAIPTVVGDCDCMLLFGLETLAKKYPRQLILLFVDGAGNHHCDELEVPSNIILRLLPPYSPELNPQENLWDEIREKIFKNYALKSMDEVYAKLEDAPALVKSITCSPTSQSHSDLETV
jgi:DDE superfamily endonuclease